MSDLADLITVLVCTSPLASDPSTETIAQTIESVRNYDDLVYVDLTFGCDGVRPEQRPLDDAYKGKVDALVQQYVIGDGDDDGRYGLLNLPQWGHQANVMRMLLAHVTTPLVLFMEHDTPLLPADTCPIDWHGCAQTLIDGELDLIRFHHESRVIPEHEHLMIGGDDEDGATRRVPYLRTVQWSQRPHLARTDWYRRLIETYFARSSRTMIEDVMHGVVTAAWKADGLAGWNRWKLAIYADMEPTMQRSYHLDGRAGGDKYEMCFAYPGDSWPDGAPAPTLGRMFGE